MKKRVIIIILLICLLIDVQRVSAAEVSNSSQYPLVGVVYCVDYRLDLVYFTDGYNNWYFIGVEDWDVKDTIVCIMDDNGTPEIKDDEIIPNSCRYSDLTINIDGIEYKTIR